MVKHSFSRLIFLISGFSVSVDFWVTYFELSLAPAHLFLQISNDKDATITWKATVPGYSFEIRYSARIKELCRGHGIADWKSSSVPGVLNCRAKFPILRGVRRPTFHLRAVVEDKFSDFVALEKPYPWTGKMHFGRYILCTVFGLFRQLKNANCLREIDCTKFVNARVA